MSLTTSTHFASAIVSGADWRECSKKVLEELAMARTENDGFNTGFLYFTDALAEDATSILGLFKSVTGIDNWTGCTGMGVAGPGVEYIDQPAISAMIGRFDPSQYKTFSATHTDQNEIKKEIQPWLESHAPMLLLLHGDGGMSAQPEWTVGKITEMMGGFAAGGLALNRDGLPVHFSTEIMTEGFSGAAFSAEVAVASGLSQGCLPLGGPYTATRADDHIIFELEGTKPLEIFTQALKQLVISETGKDPDAIVLESVPENSTEIPQEFKDIFRGEVHVAFPVTGSDMNDYLVRDIAGVDAEDGYIAVAHPVQTGDRILFVRRDDETVRNDLSQMLVNLRARVQHERGEFQPRGAIYISCAARAFTEFEPGQKGGEMALVKEIIGDIPLTGFYAGGEISGGRVYGYTGVLILFL